MKYFIQIHGIKMKTILIVLVLVMATINCQDIDEFNEINMAPIVAPAGFSESGHYGTHYASSKTYFRSNTHVRFN